MTDRVDLAERRLFDAACAGRLDESARSQLQQLLRTSPDARQRYLDHTALHADLFAAVRVRRVHDRVVEALHAEDAAETRRIIDAAPSRRARAGVVAGIFATAAAIALVVNALTEQPTNETVATSTESVAEEGVGSWRGLVARVNRLEAVEWRAESQAFIESDLLSAGESIALTRGLVEVEFRQGAVVVLEGPAHLVALDANAASLLQGKLAAVAPPWATGFRVDTPGVDVVDHGTEFAVNVTGDGRDAQVNVVVTEGEVEVLADEQADGGRRLRAGEGVQSSAGSVEAGDDAAARLLTERLPDRPELKSGVVVADRWADWSPGVEGEPNRKGPWRFYTNSDAEFGDPAAYDELIWESSSSSYRPSGAVGGKWLDKYVRVHREGGHPGKGRDQVWDKFDRYSITGFVVPEDGVYRIESGWLERLWARRWDRDGVLDVAVHVNDGPVVMREFCNRESFVAFRHALGQLIEGDTVYVGVGPNGVDFNDKFRWGFVVVRDNGDQDDDSPTNAAELAATD